MAGSAKARPLRQNVLHYCGVQVARIAKVAARLWRARARAIVAVTALGTAVTWKPGWIGWALGLIAATGVVVFEFGQWWQYVLNGERRDPPAPPRLSGSGRFREAGTTTVWLQSVGTRPDLVRRRLRFMTGLDEAQLDSLTTGVPAALPDRLSLSSAELVVDGLRSAGAEAQLLISGEFAGPGDHG